MAQVRKALISIEGQNEIKSCDAIEHAGGVWIVPEWLVRSDGKQKKPVRMIRLLSVQPTSFAGHSWIAPEPLPAHLFDLSSPLIQDPEFPAVHLPDLLIPT